MDSAYDIPDATDWLETPLKGLATVENALHCSICKDFYDTPMITSCCHTFCSKCIRTSLSADGKCPACRTADQASKLRNNWALQELVTSFLDARPAALKVARKEQEAAEEAKRPGKRKRVVLSLEGEPARTTRSKSRRIAASQESQPGVVEVGDSDEDEDETFEPEEPAQDDCLVECPLGCGKRMKIEAVEPHLDKCEDERKHASRSKSRTPVIGFGSSNSLPPSSGQPTRPDRLPELSYPLFNETILAKKLRELGIPSTGSKQLMIKRHKEWVNIWNANCDSNRPRGKRELLQELDGWERTQGGKAPNVNGLASTIMKKDFNANGWATSNKSDFSRLIADARRKKSNQSIECEKAKDVEMDGATDGVDARSKQAADTSTEPEAGPLQTVGDIPILLASDSDMADLSTNREPVDAANLRHHFSRDGETTVPPQSLQPGADGIGLPSAPGGFGRQSSRDEHTLLHKTGAPCELPAHPHSSESPSKKLPMLAVPSQAVSDADGGGGFSGS